MKLFRTSLHFAQLSTNAILFSCLLVALAILASCGGGGFSLAAPTRDEQPPNLAGTGPSAASLSPSSVFFGTRLLATPSAQSTVTLTNSGASALTINSIAVAGANSSDFGVTHNCPISPNTLAAGNSCTLEATFTPQAAGPRKSSITISDNAGSGVQMIFLTGVGAAISTAPSSLNFNSQQLGTHSTAMSVVITNEGGTAVNLWQIAFVGANAGDFAQSTSTCGNSLGAGANCTVNVFFTPAATGSRTASLLISDDGGGSPQAVTLAGTGTSGVPAGNLPVRTRYVRTDATTEYFGYVNQHWILYHPSTGRYFVTDPSSNRVIVIDAASQTELGTIGVPGAFGIDQTPDYSTLYVGTQIGDVYTIDPVGMKVTNRYMASQIGPSGYSASSALVLSDGQLALIGIYNGIDGASSIAVWNPTNNSIVIYGGGQGQPSFPCGNIIGTGQISGFTLSADRTQIIFGIGETLCEIDASTGAGTYASGTSLELVSLYHITVTPDGKYIILPNNLLTLQPSVAVVFDAHTLATVAQFSVLGNTSSASGFFVSADSTTLFISGGPETATIYAYSLATQQLVGWLPDILVEPTGSGSAFGPIDSPYLLATDGTGLFVGPMEEGVGFVDLSILQTGAVGTQFTNGYLTPATGPTSGGTATQWSNGASVGPLKSIYFGSQQATAISANSVTIHATSPSGKPGPADVYAFTTDGGMQLLPEAFSYGPTILEVTPNMATAEGGGTGYIYGYGFGPTNSNTIPANLQVTVAGTAATITGFSSNAYGLAAPPFPLQGVAFSIPPGVSGSAVSVTVSTNAGSATATGALSYLPATQQFPLTGSTLAQGVYDSYTDLYYFTDTTQIQVFSRAEGKWLSPIPITPPAGTTERLWGIALSPDGSKLAVSDANAGAIYLLDPANPTSVQTFIVGSQTPFTVNPCGLAISDAGNVYYMVFVIGQGGGADQFFKLNTNTGAITNYGINGPGFGYSDEYLRNAISSDNTRVFFNEDGLVFSIDTATDQFSYAADDYGCCYGNYELALSSNQALLTATFYIYDSSLNGESYYALNDREILNIAYVYGAKLSPNGRLLFQPSTNGIDVFDGELGNLQDRVSLPVQPSPNYDALVSDGKDNVLIAITGATGDGIAVVDLTSIAEPLALTSNSKRFAEQGVVSHRQQEVGKHPEKRSPQSAMRPHTPPHITKPLLLHAKRVRSLP